MSLNPKTITFRVEDGQIELIDKYCKKLKINRSHLIRNFIDSGLDDLKLMEKTGLLALALKGRDLLDIVRISLDEDKFEVENDRLVIDL